MTSNNCDYYNGRKPRQYLLYFSDLKGGHVPKKLRTADLYNIYNHEELFPRKTLCYFLDVLEFIYK